MHSISLSNPEKAGIVANDIIGDLLISRICPQGGVFFDIGAQYGAVFSSAWRHDPTLKVYAFEADTTKASTLKKVHPRLTVFDLAVGDAEGVASFYLDAKASGYNSLVPGRSGTRKVSVRVSSIDALLPNQPVDVMKVDVEGAELGVFKGAEQTIMRYFPLLMFECVLKEENTLGYSAGAIWKWLNDRDYLIFSPNRMAHNSPAYSKQAFVEAQNYPFQSHNWFAIHASRREEFRDAARSILKISKNFSASS
ncbi:MAG: FkbM family methyltransferase [Pseudomonadota bacterium]